MNTSHNYQAECKSVRASEGMLVDVLRDLTDKAHTLSNELSRISAMASRIHAFAEQDGSGDRVGHLPNPATVTEPTALDILRNISALLTRNIEDAQRIADHHQSLVGS